MAAAMQAPNSVGCDGHPDRQIDPPAVTVCSEVNRWGREHLVFTVPLPDRDPVFMSMPINEYTRDNSAVVVVDAAKFLELWRADPNDLHRGVALGSPQTWPDDYKYHHAVDGYSHGRENPVPLADVSYRVARYPVVTRKFLGLQKQVRHEEVEAVGFTNGVTRTIWLLTQGCQAFPVKCGLSCMAPLARAAAVPGSSPYIVGELAALGTIEY